MLFRSKAFGNSEENSPLLSSHNNMGDLDPQVSNGNFDESKADYYPFKASEKEYWFQTRSKEEMILHARVELQIFKFVNEIWP